MTSVKKIKNRKVSSCYHAATFFKSINKSIMTLVAYEHAAINDI